MINYKKYHRDKTYKENESLFRNIFQKRYDIAKKFIIKPGKVLDIGTSTGTMLDIFKDNSWETWGVEPSQSSSVAIEKGHKIIKNYFEKAKLPKAYFDFIIANHTLEHMDDPILVLRKIHSLLKSGGIVYIDVPNAGGIASRILGKHWPYRLPLEHKHQFTRTSLSKIFIKAGFKVIHFESRSGIFEFANPVLELWSSLTTFKKRFFTNILTFPYALFANVSNSGDSMSMVGRKK